MTVHSLVLIEDGSFTELSKQFDLSKHNSMRSPETQELVEDNYVTFLYPEHLSTDAIIDYANAHCMHLIESCELSVNRSRNHVNAHQHNQTEEMQNQWPRLDSVEGYKMYRIHYWTEKPTHWVLNPESDLFVFNNEAIKSMVQFN